MGEYRICPASDDGWKVQGRWLGVLWRDLGRWVGYQTWAPHWFETEAEAEQFINSLLENETRERSARINDFERRATIRPRVYP